MLRMANDVSHRPKNRLTLDPHELAQHQLTKLNSLLEVILPTNQFYQSKLSQYSVPLETLEQLAELPFTFKDELLTSGEGNIAANLTYPVDHYVRFHRTSGTRGRPLVVLDTADDWNWWMECWSYVLDAAEVDSSDRVMMAFSFGPFIGFWSAYDAVIRRGALVAPAGGLSTLSRLELVDSLKVTSLFCTPSYALHMAEVAVDNQIDVGKFGVQKIIVAGEPGGSVPSVRERIEGAWNARVIDHSGASEIGPWGFADGQGKGIYINECEFIAEFLSVESGELAGEGQLSELVLTTLGRVGSPVIRYRTGDLVRPTWNDDQGCSFVLLQGGVLGRTDDMMIIRGVNIFPSAIEQILRGFPEVVEYRMTAFKQGEMDALRIEVEDRLSNPQRVADEMKIRLGLNVEVESAEIGSLPRFEGKGKRFIDER